MKKEILNLTLVILIGLMGCKNKTNTESKAITKKENGKFGLIASFGDIPSITYSSNNEIGVVFGNEESIYFSSSTDYGESFSKPLLVSSLKGLALGYSSGPEIAITKSNIIITAPNKDGNLYSWTKSIISESWEGPFRINDVDKSAGENLSAITSSPDGKLYCTWIDTRFLEKTHNMNHSNSTKKAETNHNEEKKVLDLNKMTPTGITYKELFDKIGDIPKNATLNFHDDSEGNLLWVLLDNDRNALKAENFKEFKKFRERNGNRIKPQGKIYIATSNDGGKSWSKSKLVYQSPDGSICECCKPSISSDAKGGIYIMFRNNINGSRDLHITKSMDNGETFTMPEKMGTGTWKIDGCPMDGGDLTISDKLGLITAWQREGEIFIASDNDSEEQIGYGRSPSISSNNKTTYMVYSKGEDIMATNIKQLMPKKIGTGNFPKVLNLEKNTIYFWVNDNGVNYKKI